MKFLKPDLGEEKMFLLHPVEGLRLIFKTTKLTLLDSLLQEIKLAFTGAIVHLFKLTRARLLSTFLRLEEYLPVTQNTECLLRLLLQEVALILVETI